MSPPAEAGPAAVDQWARDLVAGWPPLTEAQTERLAVLLDLSGEEPGRDAG